MLSGNSQHCLASSLKWRSTALSYLLAEIHHSSFNKDIWTYRPISCCQTNRFNTRVFARIPALKKSLTFRLKVEYRKARDCVCIHGAWDFCLERRSKLPWFLTNQRTGAGGSGENKCYVLTCYIVYEGPHNTMALAVNVGFILHSPRLHSFEPSLAL